MKKRLLVVGNGMVAHRFLETFAGFAEAADWEIACIGEEPLPAYDRVHLSGWFEHRDAGQMLLAGPDWYRDQGIRLVLGSRVTRLDLAGRRAHTDQGGQEEWDVLVLATGSSPFVPPMAGTDKAGVFVYRSVADLERIAAWAGQASRAVVIGGGLLGLEAARATHGLGLPTAVVEYAPWLMPRQIDQTGGRFLDRAIRELGVEVYTTCRTTALTGGTCVTGVATDDGTTIPADLVLISAGIKPRDDLARDAGLVCGSRGGVVVDGWMRTSEPGVYAVGECACAGGMVYGLVAPGYRMAETAAAMVAGRETAPFAGADLSTKLKLLGVDVASIGNPVTQPPPASAQAGAGQAGTGPAPEYHDLILTDTAKGVYKRLQVDPATRTLKSAILVGDASEYSSLLQLYLNQIPLPEDAQGLLVPNGGGVKVGADSLPDNAIICSCNNISKKTIVDAVRAGNHDLDSLKVCTRAGTGCGSCLGMVKDLMVKEMERSGIVVDKSLCEHFRHTRTELYEIVRIKGYRSFAEVLAGHGQGRGCETCKPVVASILASIHNEPAFAHDQLQDTNDRFLANIQKNGTYGVVPRAPGGEITPDQLMVIGQVAKDFDLYTKITGAQRIDLFGARLEDLPKIWRRLVDAGMESGQAYAKALRAAKSCVGSAWCRFGVQDSTSLAIELENRYKGLRSPHKLKFGVSGCARECAEARGKDVGVIATEKGWNLYVCGNGGMNPAHARLLATDLDVASLKRYIDRFLIYYIRTADKLTRTAPWLDSLDGGLDKLKAVVIEDSLGLGREMEAEMDRLVAGYQDEWRAVLENPEKLARFQSFVNTDAADDSLEWTRVRGQRQPVERTAE